MNKLIMIDIVETERIREISELLAVLLRNYLINILLRNCQNSITRNRVQICDFNAMNDKKIRFGDFSNNSWTQLSDIYKFFSSFSPKNSDEIVLEGKNIEQSGDNSSEDVLEMSVVIEKISNYISAELVESISLMLITTRSISTKKEISSNIIPLKPFLQILAIKPFSRYYPSNLSSFGFISLTIINSNMAQDNATLGEAVRGTINKQIDEIQITTITQQERLELYRELSEFADEQHVGIIQLILPDAYKGSRDNANVFHFLVDNSTHNVSTVVTGCRMCVCHNKLVEQDSRKVTLRDDEKDNYFRSDKINDLVTGGKNSKILFQNNENSGYSQCAVTGAILAKHDCIHCVVLNKSMLIPCATKVKIPVQKNDLIMSATTSDNTLESSGTSNPMFYDGTKQATDKTGEILMSVQKEYPGILTKTFDIQGIMPIKKFVSVQLIANGPRALYPLTPSSRSLCKLINGENYNHSKGENKHSRMLLIATKRQKPGDIIKFCESYYAISLDIQGRLGYIFKLAQRNASIPLPSFLQYTEEDENENAVVSVDKELLEHLPVIFPSPLSFILQRNAGKKMNDTIAKIVSNQTTRGDKEGISKRPKGVAEWLKGFK